MKVYISGSIQEQPKDVLTAKFNAANKKVENIEPCHGYFECVNPLDIKYPNPISPPYKKKGFKQRIVKRIEALVECDAIYMINDWKDCQYSRVEFEVARELGLILYFESNIN